MKMYDTNLVNKMLYCSSKCTKKVAQLQAHLLLGPNSILFKIKTNYKFKSLTVDTFLKLWMILL